MFDEYDDFGLSASQRRRGHDVAQICLNGHMVNASSRSSPQFNKKFCDRCGKSTITECQSCHQAIKGRYYSGGYLDGIQPDPPIPAYCVECGNPYPWTESSLTAARAVVLESEELTQDERESFASSIEDLATDNPRTELSALNAKKFLAKLGQGTATALRSLLVDIASETAKKILTDKG